VQVKANHKKLFHRIKELTTYELEPTDTFSEQESKKHNRIEYREISVFPVVPGQLPYDWVKLKTLIRVRRYTDKLNTKHKKWCLSTEASYYGATYSLDAKEAAKAIRFHWHIENRNHYVRDVSLGEDASRIRKNPVNFARLRSFALNLFRKNNIMNIKQAIFENALNFDNLLAYQGIF
jgi:predicted transposase YbfD/YdcC